MRSGNTSTPPHRTTASVRTTRTNSSPTGRDTAAGAWSWFIQGRRCFTRRGICCADRRWLGSRAPRLRSSVSSHRGRCRSVPGCDGGDLDDPQRHADAPGPREWPRGTRRQGPRHRASSAGSVSSRAIVVHDAGPTVAGCRAVRPPARRWTTHPRRHVGWTPPVAVSDPNSFEDGTGSAGIRCRTRDGARGTRTQECFNVHMYQ